LEITSPEVTLRLWKGRSARGWVKKEPQDDDFKFEQPKLLMRSVMMLVEQGVLSKDILKDVLGIPLKNLEELCCLPAGYFSAGHESRVVDIRLRSNPHSKSSSHERQESSVLNFPTR
jgi:hypothetical protein